MIPHAWSPNKRTVAIQILSAVFSLSVLIAQSPDSLSYKSLHAISPAPDTVHRSDSLSAHPSSQELESRPPGFLKVVCEEDSTYYVVDGDFQRPYEVRFHDSIPLSPGVHTCIVAQPNAPDLSGAVMIMEDSTRVIRVGRSPRVSPSVAMEASSYARIFHASNLIILTDKESDIFIDGQRQGRGSLRFDLPTGVYTVETRHPVAGRSRSTFEVRPSRLLVREMYNLPEKYLAYFLYPIPGAKQWYEGRGTMGSVLLVGFAALVGGAISFQKQYTTDYNTYLSARISYGGSSTEEEALRWGNEMEEAFRKSRASARTRDIFLYSSLLVYLFHLWDGLRGPPSGYRAEQAFELYKTDVPPAPEGALSLKIRLTL